MMLECRSAFLLFLVLCSLYSCSKSLMNSKQEKIIFSDSERKMILSGNEDKPMRVYKINNTSDSILLRTPSRELVNFVGDPALELFNKRLLRTVRDSMSLGVGIAAPQVGILSRIIYVQRFDKEDAPFEVYYNPEILQYSEKKQTRREGCLSIPDRRDTLSCRAYAILIDYDRPDGSHVIEMVEDFTAIIFQHEIDHLNGILYTDHLEKEIEEARFR